MQRCLDRSNMPDHYQSIKSDLNQGKSLCEIFHCNYFGKTGCTRYKSADFCRLNNLKNTVADKGKVSIAQCESVTTDFIETARSIVNNIPSRNNSSYHVDLPPRRTAQ